MNRFQNKRMTNILGLFLLAGLIAGGMFMGCCTSEHELRATLVPTTVAGIVVSDTRKAISEAKVVAHWSERGVKKSMEVISGADGSFLMQLPAMPSKIEASKPEFFSAKLEPKTGVALTGLTLVLEGGGKINVDIKGIDKKEELQFLVVKAISAGKEYQRETNMYVKLAPDREKGLREDTKAGVTCVISRVPAGPTVVQVSLKNLNLPSQTVEVKGGVVVSCNFDVEFNKVLLNGIVMHIGKPQANWLILFKRTDGNPISGTSGVITPADGWYEIKLEPATYEIQLNEPGVFEISGAKVKGHVLKYTTTYTLTKPGTLNLDICSLEKVEPKKSK